MPMRLVSFKLLFFDLSTENVLIKLGFQLIHVISLNTDFLRLSMNYSLLNCSSEANTNLAFRLGPEHVLFPQFGSSFSFLLFHSFILYG